MQLTFLWAARARSALLHFRFRYKLSRLPRSKVVSGILLSTTAAAYGLIWPLTTASRKQHQRTTKYWRPPPPRGTSTSVRPARPPKLQGRSTLTRLQLTTILLLWLGRIICKTLNINGSNFLGTLFEMWNSKYLLKAATNKVQLILQNSQKYVLIGNCTSVPENDINLHMNLYFRGG